MNKFFKVLKKWGDHKKGEVVEAELLASLTGEEVAELVDKGVLKEEATPPVLEKNVWAVLDKNGLFVRAYTTEIHGEDAEKLANQFSIKIKGTVN